VKPRSVYEYSLHNLYHDLRVNLLCVQSSLIMSFHYNITNVRVFCQYYTSHYRLMPCHAYFLPLPLPLARPRPLNPLFAGARFVAFLGCGPPPSSPSLQ